MSRLSFRPRPLDINKKLPLVRSTKELDSEEGLVSRTVHHGHIALDAENEQVLPAQASKKGAKEIPIPHCTVVPLYDVLYPHNFVQPPSYIRCRAARSDGGEFLEYDLDDEDEDWLEAFNSERQLLSGEEFEAMLYRLEVTDAKQRERARLGMLVLGTIVPVMLQRDHACEILRSMSQRQAIPAVVFDYWKAKRERWGKPILRRLQPAPAVTDSNPFNVFRPREKIHRPHTRRMQRRENDMSSYEKLLQVHQNLEGAMQLLDLLCKREEKKRELAECEVQLQQSQLFYRHMGTTELALSDTPISSEPVATPPVWSNGAAERAADQAALEKAIERASGPRWHKASVGSTKKLGPGRTSSAAAAAGGGRGSAMIDGFYESAELDPVKKRLLGSSYGAADGAAVLANEGGPEAGGEGDLVDLSHMRRKKRRKLAPPSRPPVPPEVPPKVPAAATSAALDHRLVFTRLLNTAKLCSIGFSFPFLDDSHDRGDQNQEPVKEGSSEVPGQEMKASKLTSTAVNQTDQDRRPDEESESIFLPPASAPRGAFRARVGRGGRIIFDRWNVLLREPINGPVPIKPTDEAQQKQ